MGIRNVRVLGRLFKITREKSENNYGLCDREKGTINVVPELDSFMEKDIHLHEIMHAILGQQGFNHPYKLEESFVRPLATGIITVLRDNPAFAKWLLSPIK